jgi:hypothetical protein
MVPLMVRFELLAVAAGHWLSNIDALSLKHEDVMVQVPVTSPPQAAVLLQVPPELPHPDAANARADPTNAKSRILMFEMIRRRENGHN